MDVTCERCSTAYEFDDALVSERGTTVKCTNCGHQFKVKRPLAAGAPERWLVRTIDGRELEFKALRELQTAIAQTQISREDVLLRGGSRPRRLGSIAELEPFFLGAGPHPTHATTMGLGEPARRQRTPTPQGLGVAGLPGPQRTEGSVAIPLPTGPRELNGLDDETSVMPPTLAPRTAPRRPPPSVPPPRPPSRSMASTVGYPGVVVSPTGAPQIPEGEAPRARSGEFQRTLPVPLDDAMPPPARTPHVEIISAHALEPATQLRVATPPPAPTYSAALDDVRGLPPLPEPAPSNSSSPRLGSIPPATPTPGTVRNSFSNEDTYGEPRFSSMPSAPRRSGAARWIVGFVVAGMLALTVATLGPKYIWPAGKQAGSPADERIGALLAEGEKSLLDGDVEGAQDQFAKASVLADKDARVATDLAHLAAVRGDIAWLRVRLLPEGDPDLDTAKRELAQAAERARKAAATAAELAPNDLAVTRARVDALRLSDDVAGARKLVASITAASSQPDNALALAELDLAEAKPDWPTVIGRLRTALSVDQNLGRARAMLVYALARSGDVTAAKAELDRIIGLARPHPLVRPMRAFVTREASAAAEPSGSAAAGKPAPGKGALPGSGAKDHPIDPPSGGNTRSGHDEPTPPAGGTVDTSDLPGTKTPPPTAATVDTPPTPTPTAAPTPPPTSTVPAGVDTSDLPGFK
ncbi:MAG: zinc-ribbon domain-containing protein [Byssovorax sp.]